MGSYSHLAAAEPDRIADMKANRQSVRAIAQALCRSPTTISPELRRNALVSGTYLADILARICDDGPGNLDNLLPWNWTAGLQAAPRSA